MKHPDYLALSIQELPRHRTPLWREMAIYAAAAVLWLAFGALVWVIRGNW